MEHLTIVLDGNYGAYKNNNNFIKLLEDVCFCINAYATNAFNIFDLLLTTSEKTILVAQNYKIPLQQKFINIKQALESAVNKLLPQVYPETQSLCLTTPLAKAALLQNKSQCLNQYIINRKLVILLASDTIELKYDCEQFLQTIYQLIQLSVETHVVFFSKDSEPGLLAQLSSQTSGSLIYVNPEYARGALHTVINTIPKTDEASQIKRQSSGIASSTSAELKYHRQLKTIFSEKQRYNTIGERMTQIGPCSCIICETTSKNDQMLIMCRHCMRLYCENCVQSKKDQLCKCRFKSEEVENIQENPSEFELAQIKNEIKEELIY